MLLSVWYALGVFGTIMLLCWLFIDDKRVVATGTLSTATWGMMAITAGTVQKTTLDGTKIATDLGALQYFTMGLSLLSLLAVLMYWADHYPPATDRPEEVNEYGQ
jgi:hypothetical protein